MLFHSLFHIGQVVSKDQLLRHFPSGATNSVRFNRETDEIAVVVNFAKDNCREKWIGNTLHFTGVGRVGNQVIHKGINAKLAKSNAKHMTVHLLQILEQDWMVYCGQVVADQEPYTETRLGRDGEEGSVWVIPLRSHSFSKIKKPELLTFSDMEDYLKNGEAARKERVRRKVNYKGCRIQHVQHGLGTVNSYAGGIMSIRFDNGESKSYKYELSARGGYLHFVD